MTTTDPEWEPEEDQSAEDVAVEVDVPEADEDEPTTDWVPEAEHEELIEDPHKWETEWQPLPIGEDEEDDDGSQ